MEDLVTIATLYNLAEAEVERVTLEAEDIRVFATDENLSSLLTPATFGGIKLQVAAADAERATEILDALRAEAQSQPADADEGVTFSCPSCHAEIWFPLERRGHVEICPECGGHVDVPDKAH